MVKMGQSQSNEPNPESVREILRYGPEFFNAIAHRFSGSHIQDTEELLTRMRYFETDSIEFDSVEKVPGERYTFKVTNPQPPLKLHDIVRFESSDGLLWCECVVTNPNRNIVRVASYINPRWKLSSVWSKENLDLLNKTMNGDYLEFATIGKRLTYPIVPIFPAIGVSHNQTMTKQNFIDVVNLSNYLAGKLDGQRSARALLYIRWWYNQKSARHGRYIIVKLGLSDEREEYHALHANCIVIDKVDRIAARIESHGESPMYDAPYDRKIEQFLQLSCAPAPIRYYANRTERFISQIQYQNNLCASWNTFCALEAVRKHHMNSRGNISSTVSAVYNEVSNAPHRIFLFLANLWKYGILGHHEPPDNQYFDLRRRYALIPPQNINGPDFSNAMFLPKPKKRNLSGGETQFHVFGMKYDNGQSYVAQIKGPLSGDADAYMQNMSESPMIAFYIIAKDGKYFQKNSDGKFTKPFKLKEFAAFDINGNVLPEILPPPLGQFDTEEEFKKFYKEALDIFVTHRRIGHTFEVEIDQDVWEPIQQIEKKCRLPDRPRYSLYGSHEGFSYEQFLTRYELAPHTLVRRALGITEILAINFMNRNFIPPTVEWEYVSYPDVNGNDYIDHQIWGEVVQAHLRQSSENWDLDTYIPPGALQAIQDKKTSCGIDMTDFEVFCRYIIPSNSNPAPPSSTFTDVQAYTLLPYLPIIEAQWMPTIRPEMIKKMLSPAEMRTVLAKLLAGRPGLIPFTDFQIGKFLRVHATIPMCDDRTPDIQEQAGNCWMDPKLRESIQHGIQRLPNRFVFHILKRIGRYRWSDYGQFLWDLMSAHHKKSGRALEAGAARQMKSVVGDRIVSREKKLGFKDLEARRYLNDMLANNTEYA